VSISGISWAICKSASRSRQITIPAPHHSVFCTGRTPFLPPNQQRQSTEGTSSDRKYLRKSRRELMESGTAGPVLGHDRKWNWVTLRSSLVWMLRIVKLRTTKSSQPICDDSSVTCISSKTIQALEGNINKVATLQRLPWLSAVFLYTLHYPNQNAVKPPSVDTTKVDNPCW